MRSGRPVKGTRANWNLHLRDQNHRQQHAQPAPEHSGPIAAHPLASSDPPLIIETARQLGDMIAYLQATGSFAFDSEFIRERSYESRLCLVQVATAEKVFLVDPLGGQQGQPGLDLSSLWELLVSPTVEKIVLAGQQDFDTVVQLSGGKRPPGNVMDLQIAAGFVHVDYPLSLSRVIEEFAGVPLGKGLAFSHWDRRPLSASQVRYAADDVRYLPAARAAIGKRLAAVDRTAWAREECASILEDLTFYRPAPETLYLRVRRRDTLSPRQLAVLRELAIVRDQAARREDMPVRTLLRDEVLLVLARWPVRKLEDLDAIRGLPRPVELRYGRQIIEATARALALQNDQLPPAEYIDGLVPRGQMDAMLLAVNAFCVEQSIAPSMVTSRKELTRACWALRAGAAATGSGPMAEHRLCRGWRKQLLGDLLVKNWLVVSG